MFSATNDKVLANACGRHRTCVLSHKVWVGECLWSFIETMFSATKKGGWRMPEGIIEGKCSRLSSGFFINEIEPNAWGPSLSKFEQTYHVVDPSSGPQSGRPAVQIAPNQ
jgi:hypothetical protein